MKHKKLLMPVLRRGSFVLLILASFIIQFTLLPKAGISASVYLLIPVSVCIAMFEKEFSGLFFGLLAGALWDLASPVTDGSLALFFALSGCIAGLLTHYLLRNTLLTAIILSFLQSVIYTFILQIYFIESFSFEMFSVLLKEHYIPPVLLASLLSIPVYFLIRKLSGIFHSELFSRGQ
ncbi:MAG: rod shape-determining protein MreD [Clostridia bacterium]|nr:rod shape-determining protein MreD [Clostridia bacterium]